MDSKISEMPIATELGNTDLIPIVQDGINKTITADQIIGTGNNANGNWIKYNSGVMICYNSTELLSSLFDNLVVTGTYRSGTIPFNNFPQTFVGAIPMIFFDITAASAGEPHWIARWGGDVYPATLTNPGRPVVMKNTPISSTVRVSYMAIGRWK